MCGCSGCGHKFSQSKPDICADPGKDRQGQNRYSFPSHFVGIQSYKTDPEGQSSDMDPLDQTQGNMGHKGGIQGQRHIAQDTGSQARTYLSISRSAPTSLTGCSGSLIEFHSWGPGSDMWAGCRHEGLCTHTLPLPTLHHAQGHAQGCVKVIGP